MNLRRTGGTAACAALVAGLSFGARAANLDEMAETIRALQARVEALEGRSRRDRADADAARAELRASRRTIAPRPLITKDVPVAVTPLAPVLSNGFEGAYATILAGYSFGPDAKATPNPYFLGYESPHLSSLSNSRLGVSVGYNRVVDDLLFGVEGRVRTDFGNTSSASANLSNSTRMLPFIFNSLSNQPVTTYPDFQLSANATSRRVLLRDVGGDVAARFGITVNDWLFYGRLGAGVEALRVERTLDERGTLTCVSPIVQNQRVFFGAFPYFNSSVVGCTAQRAGSITNTTQIYASPYVVLGAGVERNFGNIFARVEGNLYLNLPPGLFSSAASGVSYNTELLGAVGYRF